MLLMSIEQQSQHRPNPAVERDGHKLRLWFPTLRSGRPSLLRYAHICESVNLLPIKSTSGLSFY